MEPTRENHDPATHVEPGRDSRKRRTGRSARQAEKSEAMRIQALETTIDCLVANPYSEVSIAAIARQGNLTRGGIQYHFATRLSLLQATVQHLHRRRLEQFRADLIACPEGVDIVDHVVDTHWRHLNERDFRAYQELVLAARCEPELAATLAGHYQAFLGEWRRIAQEHFGWDHKAPEMARAGNIAHYILDGMAYGQLGGQLEPEEIGELLGYVKSVMRQATSGSPH
ncbi:MAG: TetR/AcrR family transcriptional regulator [Sphingomonadaceae bacterium]